MLLYSNLSSLWTFRQIEVANRDNKHGLNLDGYGALLYRPLGKFPTIIILHHYRARGVAQVVSGRTVNPEVLSSTLVLRLSAPDDFRAIVRGHRDNFGRKTEISYDIKKKN